MEENPRSPQKPSLPMHKLYNRRSFLQYTSAGALSLCLTGRIGATPTGSGIAEDNLQLVWLKIGRDNSFVFYLAEAEMGQGVSTSLTTILAEELDVDPARFTIEKAPLTDEFGDQITGNSNSVSQDFEPLRKVGARVRLGFLKAAARRWDISVRDLHTENGSVHSAKGSSFTYGQLLEAITEEDIPDEAPLKDPKNFRWIGREVRNLDSVAKVCGRAEYGMDFQMKELLIAKIMRCPVLGGELEAFDASETLKKKGVRYVVAIKSGVAIVADKYWQCLQAAPTLKISWKAGEHQNLSSAQIASQYRQSLAKGLGAIVEDKGKIDLHFGTESDEKSLAREGALDQGFVLESYYEAPFLSHATMEPQNFTAWFQEDRCDVWGPTQGPTFDRAAIANFTGLSRKNIFVHPSRFIGGGFGRRGDLDFKLEAVELSRAIKKPVKVIWSREDDQMHSAFRPMSVHRMRAKLSRKGDVLAWHHEIAVQELMTAKIRTWITEGGAEWLPNVVRDWMGNAAAGVTKFRGKFPISSEGAKDCPYEIPNRRLECINQEPGVPITFWRSVGHSYNAFAVESFIDELAYIAKSDPYQFRRRLLSSHPRNQKTLDRVTSMANWEKPPSGSFYGIAQHRSFGSYVAMVAEVAVKGDEIKIKKVYCAVDCGLAINPDNIKGQIQGGIAYGISAICLGEITIASGSIKERNFDTYPVLRMKEAPEVEVEIIDSLEKPSGVGEIGVPPIGPAVANAIFAATGQRYRKTPLGFKL